MKCQLGQHSGDDLLSKLRNWDVHIGSPPFRPLLPGPFAICRPNIYTLLVSSTSNASSKQQMFKTNNESQSYSNSRSSRRKLYCMHYRVPPPQSEATVFDCMFTTSQFDEPICLTFGTVMPFCSEDIC